MTKPIAKLPFQHLFTVLGADAGGDPAPKAIVLACNLSPGDVSLCLIGANVTNTVQTHSKTCH